MVVRASTAAGQGLPLSLHSNTGRHRHHWTRWPGKGQCCAPDAGERAQKSGDTTLERATSRHSHPAIARSEWYVLWTWSPRKGAHKRQQTGSMATAVTASVAATAVVQGALVCPAGGNTLHSNSCMRQHTAQQLPQVACPALPSPDTAAARRSWRMQHNAQPQVASPAKTL